MGMDFLQVNANAFPASLDGEKEIMAPAFLASVPSASWSLEGTWKAKAESKAFVGAMVSL